MKVRDGLHESDDGHLHVSGRVYKVYETKTGDYKLVPKRRFPKGPGPSTSARRRPKPNSPRGTGARLRGRLRPS